jgi:hypothetical protein
MTGETLMHLDGCHFFVWVWKRDGQTFVDYQEREGSDLAVHRLEPDEESCQRCEQLSRGARVISERLEIPELPEDPMESLAAVAAVLPVEPAMT